MKRKLISLLLILLLFVSNIPVTQAHADSAATRSTMSVTASINSSGKITAVGTSSYEAKVVTITLYRQSGTAWIYVTSSSKTQTAITVTVTTTVALIDGAYYKAVATCKNDSMSSPTTHTVYYSN